MAQVLPSVESMYDFFVETVEELNFVSQDSEALMANQEIQQKTSLSRHESENLLKAFLQLTDKMNGVESSESFASLPSIASSSCRSEADVLNLLSFYNAMETLNIPANESTKNFQDFNRSQGPTYDADITVEDAIANKSPKLFFKLFFDAWETFLHNQPAAT